MRAEKRGEDYVAPEPVETDEKTGEKAAPSPANKDKKMMKAAQKLKKELISIQTNEELKAKERRSHKRKAEAIAVEEAGCSPEEMQKFLEDNQEALEKVQQEAAKKSTKKIKFKDGDNDEEIRPTPYIVFVGQLAYETTKEVLYAHIQKELSDEHKITPETVKVRLLTDAKSKRSRGIAFVELSDPELMYACLRLHHTLLEGRRLNVERSAGGRNKENRQARIKEFREKQEEFLSNTIDTIIGDFFKSGELQEGELDEGAIGMCKRYSAGMVETAIKEYIENNGRTMDNTSAYFSFLLGKLASDKAEGLSEERPPKRPKRDGPPNASGKKGGKLSRIAPKSSLPGVDFSMSEKDGADNSMAKIFPSLARGRGRGRGYM